jgi:hypothetical protein
MNRKRSPGWGHKGTLLSMSHIPGLTSHVALIFATILFLTSCEKEITVDLPTPREKIVVEGHVEPGQKPYVILTKNQGYFSPVDSATLYNSIIQTGFVTVNDGFTTDTLILTIDFNYLPPIIYKAKNMLGVAGRSYHLNVVAEGKTLFANTVIPQPVPLDSLWFRIYNTNNDSLGFVWAHLTDPQGLGNQYRWFAKRLHKDNTFIAPFGSEFDDKFIDGQSFDFAYNRGMDPTSTAIDDNNIEAGFFKKGDTVAVKFCTIDRDAYLFYRSFDTDHYSTGNPFASPASVISNIYPQEDALGIFCGYGAVLDTVVLVP